MSAEEEAKARAEAEARRQRILDGANSRMDKVSGIPSGENEDTKKVSKLAAMRRRRFKKKDESTTEKTEEEQSESPKAVDETPKATKEETAKPNNPEPQVETVEEVLTPGVEKEEEKKKYMGVAKMRRMKLQERKQQEAAQRESHKPKVKKSKASLVDILPIYMHLFVIALLFIAGFDVGMQTNLSYSKADLPHIVVKAPLAPREMKFINLVPSSLNPFVETKEEESPQKTEDIAIDTRDYDVDTEDEFQEGSTTPTRGVDNHDANIDPLFGVDLDALTSGPGIMAFLARQAVKVHRFFLAIFYYGPFKVVGVIGRILESLIQVPPILGLMALVLRQIVGSALGADLPKQVEEDNEPKDAMSTVMNFVKKFFAGSFPKLISLYSGWVQLRSDIYIMACGLLVGLAVSHSMLLQGAPDVPPSTATTGEEL